MEVKIEDTLSKAAFKSSTAGQSDASEAVKMLGGLLTDFSQSWRNLDGTGSLFLYNLCSTLAGSQYEGMSRDLLTVLGPVFGFGESELVLCHLRKMEALMCSITAAGNHDNHEVPNEFVLCQCLLQFVKLQADYHHLCSTTMASVINHLVTACDNHGNSELLHELRSLEILRSKTQSPTRAQGHKKGQINTGSPRAQKHGIKASLFSLFERKNSPEEGKSSFYVDISQCENTDERVEKPREISHVTNVSQSNASLHLGLDPGLQEGSGMIRNDGVGPHKKKEGLHRTRSVDSRQPLQRTGVQAACQQVLPAKNTGAKTNGEVASQEELDSVINLLSGVGMGAPMMQTIPEDHSPNRLNIPQAHASSLSPAASDSCVEERIGPRTKGQRRSEGSIDLSGFGTVPSNNTWPYQHRSSLPGGQLGTFPQMAFDFTTPPQTQGYTMDMRPTTLPPGGAGHFQGGYNWGFPDPKLNRAWPVNNLTGTGSVTDTLNSSWSGAQDSDDLSDDSSSGDHFYTMSHLQNPEQHRLSTDEALSGMKKDDRVGEVKHHSLEDLLDGRSNTWPQHLQPWSQSHQGLDLLEQPDQASFHRPLQMQLSDPLSRRNIWPAGMGEPASQLPPPPPPPSQQQQLQNMQGLPQM